MNPETSKNTKRIVAREGLIFIGFLVSCGLICFIGGMTSSIETLGPIGLGFLFFGYPLYLLIRFIIWAIRTLGEK